MPLNSALKLAFNFFHNGCKHFVLKKTNEPVIKDLHSSDIFDRLPESTLIVEADYSSTFGLEARNNLQSEIISQSFENIFFNL